MWFHFIGVCGVGMGPIALALERQGHFVTGSDKAIYPPISDYLKKNNFKLEFGYKEEHLDIKYYESKYQQTFQHTIPDVVVIGNTTNNQNEEYTFANSKKLKILSYPEIIKEYFVKKISIVVAGTYGKSTITSMLVKIFKDLGYNPTYMIGAVPLDFEHPAEITTSEISILEGDEYRSSQFDNHPKFYYYNPTHLIVTGIEWDHKDIYETEEKYFLAYISLINATKEFVLLHNSARFIEKVIQNSQVAISTYPENSKQALPPLYLTSKIFGKHNIENINAVLTFMSVEKLFKSSLFETSKLNTLDITKSLSSYNGIYRRLQIKFENESVVIIDDFAHSPSEVKSAINAVSVRYPNHRIVAVYEPNMGNRTKLSLNSYLNVFEKIDKLILPKWRFHRLSVDSNLISEAELAKNIKSNVIVEFDDSKVIEILKQELSIDKTIILFMGPEPFRGMVDEITKYAKTN